MKKQFSSEIEWLQKLYRNYSGSRLLLILIGIVSTIWFLIRVIPKPQRAAYPCMQAAAPGMAGFVLYLLNLFGTSAAIRYAKVCYRNSKYFLLTILLITILFCLAILSFQENSTAVAGSLVVVPNQPTGTERGIFPGRVVWIFNPAVAKFDGKTGNWWDEANTVQTESDRMLKSSLIRLTGKNTEAQAWDTLFKHFNFKKRSINTGYAVSQNISVKINENNTTGHADSKNINATPQLVLSLLRSLIHEAGVPQNRITVFDASRFITNNIFNKCHNEFPGVIFIDNLGSEGRIKATYVQDAIPFSADNGSLAKGIAACAVEADYLINMALLKGHSG